MKFSERVKKAREYAGLSQIELANRINALFGSGISQQVLSKLESSSESSGYTPDIASVCGVSAVWLSRGKGPMVVPPGDSPRSTHKGDKDIFISGASNKRLARIVELWHHLADDIQEEFLDRIEACVVRTHSLPEPPPRLKSTRRTKPKSTPTTK